jgi:hypothetical protein
MYMNRHGETIMNSVFFDSAVSDNERCEGLCAPLLGAA